jgi:hypothetical protein
MIGTQVNKHWDTDHVNDIGRPRTRQLEQKSLNYKYIKGRQRSNGNRITPGQYKHKGGVQTQQNMESQS